MPVHAGAAITTMSTQSGTTGLGTRCLKSVMMYGAFGRNSSQSAASGSSRSGRVPARCRS